MIKINEDFKRLIPALTQEEYKQLENNILKEGIREKIITWNGFIIDGHNRYEIAQKWDLDFETESKHFEDENAVREWMILNQFGRRNLSNYQRSVLALQLEDVFKEKAKENQGKRTDLLVNSPKSEPKDTRKELSKVASVGEQTIARVKVIEAKANEETKAKLSTGEVSINQVYQEIKKEEKKANFEQKKADFEKPIKEVNTNQIILHGDSVEILPTLDENSFDLLLSDPPYGMDFKSGWNNKEKIANDKYKIQLFYLKMFKRSVPL